MSSFIRSLKATKYLSRSKSAFAVKDLTDLDYAGAILKQRDRWLEVLRGKISAETHHKLKVAKEYWRLEMKPPTSKDEMKQLMVDLVILREFVAKRAFKNLTVKQLWLLFLVGIEISMWFYLGETIGKMHIVGYDV